MPFLEGGEEVEVLAAFHSGFVVELVYDGDGEPPIAEPFIVKQVYDMPPVAKHESRVQSLLDEIGKLTVEKESLTAEILSIQANIRIAKETRDQFNRASNSDKALMRVWNFMRGGITHVVDISNELYPSIRTPKECKHFTSRFLELLVLYGSTEGGLTWCLRDSHNNTESREIIPCASFEEAQKIVEPVLVKALDKSMGNEDSLRRLINLAAANHIEISKEYWERAESLRREELQRRAVKLRSELAEIELKSSEA